MDKRSELLGSVSRRNFLTTGAMAGAVLAAPLSWAASAAPLASPGNQRTTMRSISFKHGNIAMAGNLYLPGGLQRSQPVPRDPEHSSRRRCEGTDRWSVCAAAGRARVCHPRIRRIPSGSQRRRAPASSTIPMKRVADIYSAVDYLTSLSYVDAARIGILGICAGSGTAIKAASTERRIKAVATVSAVDVGAATRKGWDGKAPVSDQLAMLDSVAKQRSAEAAGAAPVYVNYVPKVGDTTAPRDLQEAADYYLTPRGHHPNSPNKMLLTSLVHLASFTGFDQVETLLTQPLLVVAGSEAGSLWHSHELHAKAPGPKELFIVNGATHMDLYDGDGVGRAMSKLSPFFKSNL